MTQKIQKFAVADPRTFDGDAYEVAERGVRQIKGVVEIAAGAIEPARLMARNAALERQLDNGEALDAEGWPETAEGRRWTQIEDEMGALVSRLEILARVAAFNPRKAR